ncbi:MAG: hypothetical protein ACJ8C4_09055 [Gemmataceae bacterium]
MKVLVLHTLTPKHLPPGRTANEFDLGAAATAIAAGLPDAVTVGIYGQPREVLSVLADHKPDVIFNLCEAPLGRPNREPQIAALFEWQGIPFTGCGSETLALCRRKDRTKAVLAAAGVPVPRDGFFPCVIKPADEDGSAGIDVDCVCADAAALADIRRRFTSPVVVEEFLPGREFAIAMWGQEVPEHFSFGETIFENGLQLLTYAAKWDENCAEYKNSQLKYDSVIEPALRETMIAVVRKSWQIVDGRGYLRMDVRLDSAGVPRVLDVNPNPEMTPDTGMYRAVEEAGWTWARFVQQQVEWAGRYGD